MNARRLWQLFLIVVITYTIGPRAAAEETDPYRPGVFPPLVRPGSEPPSGPQVDWPSPPAPDRLHPLLPTSPLEALAVPSGLGSLEEERGPRKGGSQSQGLWGTLTTSVVSQENRASAVWEDPLWKRTWKSDESWRCTLVGPVYVFGQLGANSEEAGQADLKVGGRTGLACKLPVGSLAEVQVRTGPGVSYTDPLRPERMRETSNWQVDVQARCPLLYGIGLEYQGVALPALTPYAQDQINQDVRLAFPVGTAGKLQLGARHRWTNTADPRPWTDGMQLYMGVELAR
jgi:hypothetical protein